MPAHWIVVHGGTPFWGALLLSIVAAWGIERALRRRRMSALWRARTRSRTHRDDVVLMAGTLRIEGATVGTFEDGAPVAIATAAARPCADGDTASVSVRARLWLTPSTA
jgi:hypothetical protein